MSYLVLARKWRPQGFEAITGQEHVTRTLTNAIEQDRVHHAFLFCGARGVGKTSAARVFARALNCRRSDGPTATPCGECEACVEIAAGTCIDVFEIDGASNRGINEIRELRDGVAYAPQRDRFKIYIIDEVHMLTTEAFNALLKTLEEPPRHVKFIFATTEPHKIPVTILSRCQRFDFKRIPRSIMVTRLSEILEAEGVAIDEGGLRIVARESEGSMRDALSLLDRIISFCGRTASYQQVAEVLGVADRRWLAQLVQGALSGDVASALAVVEGAFEFGLDLRTFATDLVHYLRDIVVLKVAGADGGLTDLSLEETQALVAMGRDPAIEDLQRLATIAIKTAERLAHANFPRLELEMAVIRMCSLRPLQPIGELVRRLEGIERHLASGAPLPAAAPFPVAQEAPARVDAASSFTALPPPTPGPSPLASAGLAIAAERSEPSRTAQALDAHSLGHATVSAVAVQESSPASRPTPAADAILPIAPHPEAAAQAIAPHPEAAAQAIVPHPEPPVTATAPHPELPVEAIASAAAAGAPAATASHAPAASHTNVIPFRPRAPAVAAPSPLPEAAVVAPVPAAVGVAPVPASEAAGAASVPPPEATVRAPVPSPPEATVPAPVAIVAAPAAVTEPASSPPGGFDPDAWEVFVDAVRVDNPSLASVLDHGQVRAFRDGVAELVFAGVNSLRRARLGEAALVELLHQDTDVRAVRFVDQVIDDLADTPFRRRQVRAERAREAQRQALERHPLVRDVVERFGGELTNIELFRGDQPG